MTGMVWESGIRASISQLLNIDLENLPDAIIAFSMVKLTPNNSRSAQMMTRAAGKGMLTAEGEDTVQSSDDSNEASPQPLTPESPRFDSLVSYPEATPATLENQPEASSDEIDRKLEAIAPDPGVYL